MLGLFVPMLLVLLSFGGVAQALGTWKIVPSANPSASNVLNAVSAVSANDVWAVGGQSKTNPALIEHWNGTKWSVVPAPALPNSTEYYLQSVAAISATDVWVVGNYFRSSDGNDYTLIEHWNGAAWSIVKSPALNSIYMNLSGLAVVSASDIWGVGGYIDATGQSYACLARARVGPSEPPSRTRSPRPIRHSRSTMPSTLPGW